MPSTMSTAEKRQQFLCNRKQSSFSATKKQTFRALLLVYVLGSTNLFWVKFWGVVLNMTKHFVVYPWSYLHKDTIYIVQSTGHTKHCTLYHGLAPFTEVHWYIGCVTVYVSVQYPKPDLAENTGNVELGAAPLVQHYSVFLAWPGFEKICNF